LAAAGFVALSFDPYQHGERSVDSHAALAARVVGSICRHFWPILAHTAEETTRVIDWAMSELGVAPQVDVSVAAAGVDERITAVAACIATPDWLRPGSCEPPGQPDSYAQLPSSIQIRLKVL
jgi:hypothetical protein